MQGLYGNLSGFDLHELIFFIDQMSTEFKSFINVLLERKTIFYNVPTF